jgi:hypothetical protein
MTQINLRKPMTVEEFLNPEGEKDVAQIPTDDDIIASVRESAEDDQDEPETSQDEAIAKFHHTMRETRLKFSRYSGE